MHLVRSVLVASALGLLAGCEHPGARPANIAVTPETFVSLARYQRVYVLAAGDQIEVSVDRLPDLTRTVTVRPDGFISLPKFGEIKLGGLSVPEADATLAKVFAQRIIAPEVTIVVQNPRDDVVFVVGEIGRPSAVPLRQAHTVAEALVLAGGGTRAAALSKVALLRLDPSGRMVASMIPRTSRGIAGSYLNMQVVQLQSGDMIVVPESGRSQFTRLVQDFINTPLTGLNQLFEPYLQYRLIKQI